MNKNEIALKKLSGICVNMEFESIPEELNRNKWMAATVNAEMMLLGFIMSKTLFELMSNMTKKEIFAHSLEMIPILKEMKGANVDYIPMYPNFPEQVMKASDFELFFNAMIHYWSFGTILPAYEKDSRTYIPEDGNFRKISIVGKNEFDKIFTTILSSNDSISDFDKEIVEYFISNRPYVELPDEIPFKENLCIVASKMLLDYDYNHCDILKFVKTPTDVLRIVTYINEGDISLATNTKFRSLPRALRRKIITLIERVYNEEDIKRHQNKWSKLFHNLHIGEYALTNAGPQKSNAVISPKKFESIVKARNGKNLWSTKGQAQKYINNGNYVDAAKILAERPGELARALDFLLRNSDKNKTIEIAIIFGEVANNISTKVLIQLYAHFKNRISDDELGDRVVFPKGNTQRAIILPPIYGGLGDTTINMIMTEIYYVLTNRFSELPSLGNVYLDERLSECPIPSGMRSSSNALDIVARGTRIPLSKGKNTLRFFIYWIGQDIDLSATFHNEDFKKVEHISYTNLRGSTLNACHSGDITHAPNGACEFIDIDMNVAVNAGYRYVCMNVLVYNGPTFVEHEKVYAGWMTRQFPNSNEIFDAKTVSNKLDLTMKSKNAIPVIFDLVERKAIWMDLAINQSTQCWGNNIESNIASIEQVVKASMNLNNKPNLFDLFEMHVMSRPDTNLVEDPAEADFIFSATKGNITPKNINEINSEYLK